MDYFKGKRVLVTGAGGFIGSHLAERLVREGASVKAMVHYNSANSWGWLDTSQLLDEIEICCGDVRDSDYCSKITNNIDVIFNLAALIAIPYSYQAPSSYIETNVNGALNICQAALNNDVERVIQTSTSEVYGTAQYIPIDEKHPLQPQSPYSASKIGADAIAMSYHNAFGLNVTIARPFNTYGPRQSARAVIPSTIIQLANGVKELHMGDGSPTRDFNYVTDTCKGFCFLAACEDTIGKTVNIGSNREISIFDTINTIMDIMGVEAKLVIDQERLRPRKSEVYQLHCDDTLIKELTGYEQEYSFEDGLRRTIEWFSNKDNLKKYKAGIYNV